jgi:hypothetical protein
MTKYGLSVGDPQLSSVGAIAFGPEGILFIADNAAATVFAIDVQDREPADVTRRIEVDRLTSRLASLLGISREEVIIRGMAVHPASGAAYLSVMRGRGDSALPVLIRVSHNAEFAVLALRGVPFAQTMLDDAPAVDDERTDVRLDRLTENGKDIEIGGVHLNVAYLPLRTSTVTDLAWVDGTLLVAGASNEEFSSVLRRIPFPFDGQARSTSLEIYHVSHGKYETASPIMAMVPFNGNTSVLASYTCTPLVHFPLDGLQPQTLAKGRTVAELGPMNQPLDMVSYVHDDEEFLLVSNTRHPLLKIPTGPITAHGGLYTPTDPDGVPREELDHESVSWMANLDHGHVLMMQRDEEDELHLRSYSTASL